MKYLFTILLLLSPFSFAEIEISVSHLKKVYDPNSLKVITTADQECATSDKELDNIVKGAVIRSRIKPIQELTDPSLFVTLNCMDNNGTVVITSRFGFYDVDRGSLVYFALQYNRLGTGDKQYIETSVKDSVDQAMTDYIRANFFVD